MHPAKKRPIDHPVSLTRTLVQLMLWVPVQVWEIKAVGCALALHFLWPWLEMTCQTKNPGNDSLCGCTMLQTGPLTKQAIKKKTKHVTWSKKANHKKKHVTCKNANRKKHQVTQLPSSWRSRRPWVGCCSSTSHTARPVALTTIPSLSKTCAVKNGTHHQNLNIKTINNQTKSSTKEYKVPWRTRARCCWGHFQTDFRLIVSLCGTNFATMSGPVPNAIVKEQKRYFMWTWWGGLHKVNNQLGWPPGGPSNGSTCSGEQNTTRDALPEIWSITGNPVTMLSLQYHLGHIM